MNTQNSNDTDTTTVTDDMLENESVTTGSLSNIPSLIGLFLTGTARDILEVADDKLHSFKNWLIVTIVAPIILLAVGMLIAANAETVSGVNTGRGFITVAGFLATVFCGMFLLRARVYAYIFLGASKAAKAALRFMPSLDTETVRTYVRYFSGIWAWVVGICLYAQVIPIYRSINDTLIAATAMLGLAAIMAAGWFGGQRAQKMLLGLVALTLVISTIRLASPRALSVMNETQDFALGTDGRTDADRTLIKRFTAEHEALRLQAATDCGGKYCSAADASRAVKLEEQIHDLQTGQYWDKLESNNGASRAQVKANAASANTEAATVETEADAAPKAAEKTETRPAAPVKAKKAAKTRDAFAELDQFQDIVAKQ